MNTLPLEHEHFNPDKEERFETDSQRIVRRHLENEDDVITDDDLRNVRIGISAEDTNTLNIEEAEKINELVEEAGKEMPDDEAIASNDYPLTPWDTVQQSA